MKVIPFRREHLELIDAREYEKEKIIPFLNDGFLSIIENSSYCYTVVQGGQIITCIGIVKLWDGVAEVWQIPSIYVAQHTKEYCCLIKSKLDEVAEVWGLWRIQTSAPADELHKRWMTYLGFNYEGTMLKYTRFKVDYHLWAKGY